MPPTRFISLPLPDAPHKTHRIAYTEWGEGNRETVICVHGLTRNSRDFDFLAETLAEHYHVICPDMPGRGHSDRLENPELYSYPLYVADMIALLTQLRLTRVHWVGTSMGGLIGMMLAASMPQLISRMVLNDVGPYLPAYALRRIAEYVGQQTVFPSRAEAEARLRTIMQPFSITEEVHWQHVMRHCITDNQDGTAAFAYDPAISKIFREPDGSLKPMEDVDLWPVWQQVACPVLLLRGEQSDVLTAETAAKMVETGANTRLITYPGIGHAPALMDAVQITDIAHFLTE